MYEDKKFPKILFWWLYNLYSNKLIVIYITIVQNLDWFLIINVINIFNIFWRIYEGNFLRRKYVFVG